MSGVLQVLYGPQHSSLLALGKVPEAEAVAVHVLSPVPVTVQDLAGTWIKARSLKPRQDKKIAVLRPEACSILCFGCAAITWFMYYPSKDHRLCMNGFKCFVPGMQSEGR